MDNIQIVTDSTSDLPRDYLIEHQIAVIPLHVSFGNRTYQDGVELSTEEMYEKVSELGMLPKTSAPSPADFYQLFTSFIEQGRQIIYIGLSSHLSSTMQNAVLASQDLSEEAIEIVDTLNLSTGIGILVMEAVDLVKQGLSLQEIASALRDSSTKVVTEFVIDTMEYLYKGGRCTGLQHVVGSMLKIHPIVQVEEGKIILVDKVRGSRMKMTEALLNRVLQNQDQMKLDRIIVTHSLAEESAGWLKAQLEEKLHVGQVIITSAGCVISAHCGPHTIGVVVKGK